LKFNACTKKDPLDASALVNSKSFKNHLEFIPDNRILLIELAVFDVRGCLIACKGGFLGGYAYLQTKVSYFHLVQTNKHINYLRLQTPIFREAGLRLPMMDPPGFVCICPADCCCLCVVEVQSQPKRIAFTNHGKK
jgi:hypothetical protein